MRLLPSASRFLLPVTAGCLAAVAAHGQERIVTHPVPNFFKAAVAGTAAQLFGGK